MKTSNLIVVSLLAFGMSASSLGVTTVARVIALGAAANSVFVAFTNANAAMHLHKMEKLEQHEAKAAVLEEAKHFSAAGTAAHGVAALLAFQTARTPQPIIYSILGVAISNIGTLCTALAQTLVRDAWSDVLIYGPIATFVQSISLLTR